MTHVRITKKCHNVSTICRLPQKSQRQWYLYPFRDKCDSNAISLCPGTKAGSIHHAVVRNFCFWDKKQYHNMSDDNAFRPWCHIVFTSLVIIYCKWVVLRVAGELMFYDSSCSSKEWLHSLRCPSLCTCVLKTTRPIILPRCTNQLTICSLSSNQIIRFLTRRQAVIWTNARISLIRTLGTSVSEILSKIQIFPFNKMHLKMSSAKWRPSCLGLNTLIWRVA